MLQKYSFSWWKAWPKLLIFWAIHGNEPCWTLAIEKYISELCLWKQTLDKGQVTFIPIANPVAYKSGNRYVLRDVNRIFWKYASPQCEEEKISDELASLIDEHDYLLDIHSTTEATVPYVFQDFNDKESELIAQSIPSFYIVSWWQDLYEGTSVGDTISYAYSVWKKGVLIECGQHNGIQARQVAYDAINSFLAHFSVICTNNTKEYKFDGCYIQMKQVFYKESEGNFTQSWKNFDFVKKGELLAMYNDWGEIFAPNDGYIIMPNDNIEIGQDWFYFWEV